LSNGLIIFQNQQLKAHRMVFAISKRLVLGVLLTALALDGSAQTQPVFTVIASFNGTNGTGPLTGVIQGVDGNFYGTTYAGGTNQGGTVFMMTPDGTLSTLYDFAFDSTNGCYPYGLVQAGDGCFYGTTHEGGDVSASNTNGYGTVFKITTNGNLTTLYAFTNGTDGTMPLAGLTLGNDGNLYGTTSGNGLGGGVFEMTTNDVFITLAQFPRGFFTPGYIAIGPDGVLTQGSDGNFYGTAMTVNTDPAVDRDNYGGAIFRLSVGETNDVLTNLYLFDSGAETTNGTMPKCALVQGANGAFYGTTRGEGAGSGGTVFQITPNSVLTTLYHFTTFHLNSGLVLGSDGNFYGVATSTADDQFEIYEITPSGTETTLATNMVPINNDTLAAGPMIQASDGNFYGTASVGGTNNDGMVFRLNVPLEPIVRLLAQSNGALTLTWNGVAGHTYQVQYSADLANWNDWGDPVVATNGSLSMTDSIGTNTLRFYQVILTQ
jgi:uncharacterized repeat protein (TIGR03803 family)